MTGTVTVDIAGAQMGGAARFGAELSGYLARTGREDVAVIGAARGVSPAWLMRRELAGLRRGRRIALNNVGFVAPGGERWTLLRNALHFLSAEEVAGLDSSLRGATGREAALVRFAARRADVLVVPSTTMADRVGRVLPRVRRRIVVRPHPVSADPADESGAAGDAASVGGMTILCPVLFAPYKQMTRRLTELVAVLEDYPDRPVRVRVTAGPDDVGPALAGHPRIEFLGRLDQGALRQIWARSRAIYFPTGIESFGYPLAEARVRGMPVIALDTAQNWEIAGPALCGFTVGDSESLRGAVERALTTEVAPDPETFNPDAYFEWMLGSPT